MADINFTKRIYTWSQKRLFIFSCTLIIYNIIKEYAAEEFESRKKVELFYDFKSLIDTAYSDKYVEKYSTQLLFIKYERECIKGNLTSSQEKLRKPFIELECNNETIRDVLLRRLAFCTGVTVLDDPAECLEEFGGHYHESHPMYAAFATLSMYANAYRASVLWHDTPVAVTGYWMQKAAYFINKAYENQTLPVYRSPVYDFPSDLLMPDIAFSVYLENQTEFGETTVRRHQEVMSKINGPVLFQLKPSFSHEELVKVMMRTIVKYLSKELDTKDFEDDT